MTADSSLFLKKIRRLSQALLVSGALNIGLLAFFSYWILRERPPTPYCELKPASQEQQQIPLADDRSCGEVMTEMRQLSYDQLIAKLSQTKLVENGYTERDLALSCLLNLYHFDLPRALPNERKTLQKRLLIWKNGITGEAMPMTIYSGLTEYQFDSITQFARTERWPLTAEGLFLLLQKQKTEQTIDPSLIEAFILTPEFLTVELLFKRADAHVKKHELVDVILDGTWTLLSQFVEQQRQLNDLSDARRQHLLLNYIRKGSETAAYLILKTDGEFTLRKLDDALVITILQLLSVKTEESEKFALALLVSPRSTSVWQQASLRLYEYAGEAIPDDWNYQTSLKRFAPGKALLPESAPKPIAAVVASPTLPAASPIPPKNSNLNAKPTQSSKPVNVTATTTTTAAKPMPPKGRLIASSESYEQPKNGQSIPKRQMISQRKAAQYRLYIVQEGDSLWKIARRFGVDMDTLKEKNQLQTNGLKPGTVLKIP